jgi:hypothetical protein
MKHILNNLSDEEKNSILEQHKGGMKVITENFSKLLNSKLGDAKPLVNEQAGDQNTHRYDAGVESPGIEKYLTKPDDVTISNGLLNQLRNDPYGKGKIIIFFNGERFPVPGEFMNKIKGDFKAGKCYTITNYEYKNRVWPLNTQITITANGDECKKQTPTPGPGPKPVPPTPKPVPPTPKVKKFCKHKISDPFERGEFSRGSVKGFQEFCSRVKMWNKELSDGTTVPCTTKDIDGKWGCCSQTCYEKMKKRKNTLG